MDTMSNLSEFWSQFKRCFFKLQYRRFPVIPGVIVSLFIFIAIFGEFLAPYPPSEANLPTQLLPPFFLAGGSMAHPLGTDELGRDLLSRILVGARPSFIVAIGVIALGGLGGTVLGIISGYAGGKLDVVLMRVADACMAFPIILLAMLLAVVLGPSMQNVIIAISIIIWARYARVIRGEVLSLKQRDFVLLARVAGVSNVKIMWHHIFFNVTHTMLVMLTLQVGMVILAEASLSFFGCGIPPPAPAWGGLIASGRNYIVSAWWIILWPGLLLMLVVLSFNMLGDWLREVLDPKLRQL